MLLFFLIVFSSVLFCINGEGNDPLAHWRHRIVWHPCEGTRELIPPGKEHEWQMTCGVVLVPLQYEANGTFRADTLPLPVGLRRLTRWRDYRSEKVSVEKSYREKRIAQRFLRYNPALRTQSLFDAEDTYLSTPEEDELYNIRYSFRSNNLCYEDVVNGRSPLPPESECSLYKGGGDSAFCSEKIVSKQKSMCETFNNQNNPSESHISHEDKKRCVTEYPAIMVDDAEEDNLLWGQEYYLVTKDDKKHLMANEQIESIINGDEEIERAITKLGVFGVNILGPPSRPKYLENAPVECYETSLVQNATLYTNILIKRGFSHIDDALTYDELRHPVRRYIKPVSFEEDAPKIVPTADLLQKKLARFEDYKYAEPSSPFNISDVYSKSYKKGKQHYIYPGLKWDPVHYTCKLPKGQRKASSKFDQGDSEFDTRYTTGSCQFHKRVLFRGGRFWIRKLVPCPRLHLWALECGLGEPYLNSRILDSLSESIKEPFHVIIPSYRGTRLFELNPFSFESAFNLTSKYLERNLLLPPSLMTLDLASLDILYLIRRFNEDLYPRSNALHFLHGNSFDTLWALRVLSLNSTAIRGVILDSAVSPLFQYNVQGSMAESEQVEASYRLCAMDPYCSSKIESLEFFSSLLDPIIDPQCHNDCLEIIEQGLFKTIANRSWDAEGPMYGGVPISVLAWFQENIFTNLMGLGIGYLHPPGDTVAVDFRVLAMSIFYQASRCRSAELFRKLLFVLYPFQISPNITSEMIENTYFAPLNVHFMRAASLPSHPTLHFTILLRDFWSSSLTWQDFVSKMKSVPAISWSRFHSYYRLRGILEDASYFQLTERSFFEKIALLKDFIWSKRNVRALSSKWELMYLGHTDWNISYLYQGHFADSDAIKASYGYFGTNIFRPFWNWFCATFPSLGYLLRYIWYLLSLFFSGLPFRSTSLSHETFDAGDIHRQTDLSAPLVESDAPSYNLWRKSWPSAPHTRALIIGGSMNQIIPPSQGALLANNSQFLASDYFRFWRGGHSLLSHAKSCTGSLLGEFFNFTSFPWDPDSLWPRIPLHRRPSTSLVSSWARIRDSLRELVLLREARLMWIDHFNTKTRKKHKCSLKLHRELCFLRSSVRVDSGTPGKTILIRHIHPRVFDSYEGFQLECQHLEALNDYTRNFMSLTFEPTMTIDAQESWHHRSERDIFLQEGKLKLNPQPLAISRLPPSQLLMLLDRMKGVLSIPEAALSHLDQFEFHIILDSQTLYETRIFRRYFYPKPLFLTNEHLAWLHNITAQHGYCDLGSRHQLDDRYSTEAEECIRRRHTTNSTADPNMRGSWIGRRYTFTEAFGDDVHSVLGLGASSLHFGDLDNIRKIANRDISIWPKHCMNIASLVAIERSKYEDLEQRVLSTLSSFDPSEIYFKATLERAVLSKMLFQLAPRSLSGSVFDKDGLALLHDQIYVFDRPKFEDDFWRWANNMQDGPRYCCHQVNTNNFLDWHQWSLLTFLGLSSTATQRADAMLGLMDEPEPLNFLALLFGTLFGIFLFVVAAFYAGRKLAAMAANHEAALKKKLRYRRRWIRLVRKLYILHYMNQEHAHILEEHKGDQGSPAPSLETKSHVRAYIENLTQDQRQQLRDLDASALSELDIHFSSDFDTDNDSPPEKLYCLSSSSSDENEQTESSQRHNDELSDSQPKESIKKREKSTFPSLASVLHPSLRASVQSSTKKSRLRTKLAAVDPSLIKKRKASESAPTSLPSNHCLNSRRYTVLGLPPLPLINLGESSGDVDGQIAHNYYSSGELQWPISAPKNPPASKPSSHTMRDDDGMSSSDESLFSETESGYDYYLH